MTVLEIKEKRNKAKLEINKILSDLSTEIDLPLQVTIDTLELYDNMNVSKNLFNVNIEVVL